MRPAHLCRSWLFVDGVLAVDCPFTWRDDAGVEADTCWARRLGYKAKSTVAPGHAAIINAVLTPNAEKVAQARRIVDGSMIEVPIYDNMRRLLARTEELDAAEH